MHDAVSNPDCVGSDMGIRPGWCKSEWCYVDPSNCRLPHARSEYFPQSGLYYSYVTCGFIDDFQRDPVYSMEGDVLRGVLIDNHRGYQGTMCDDDGSCEGPVVNLVALLARYSGLNVR